MFKKILISCILISSISISREYIGNRYELDYIFSHTKINEVTTHLSLINSPVAELSDLKSEITAIKTNVKNDVKRKVETKVENINGRESKIKGLLDVPNIEVIEEFNFNEKVKVVEPVEIKPVEIEPVDISVIEIDKVEEVKPLVYVKLEPVSKYILGGKENYNND